VCYINNINSDRKLKRPLVSGEILQSIKTSLSAFSLSK